MCLFTAVVPAHGIQQTHHVSLHAHSVTSQPVICYLSQDIVIGRHRDTEDRISWLLGAGRFEAALALAEADSSLPRAVFETVVQVCGASRNLHMISVPTTVAAL